MTVCTRFAPSPTGYLHIGGARVALYCYLFAHHHQGEFILRIEDTDRERSTAAAVDAIVEGLQWLGLWDPHKKPIYQTQRYDRYEAVLQQLLKEKKAYYCHCSRERLEKLRETQLENKEKPRYDGRCRDKNLPKGKECVIRFRQSSDGNTFFEDSIRGVVTIENHELDDLVLMRSDGNPTYNFAVVVDDADMQITHVIRGDDHINNTPRQINIFRALEVTPPKYTHLPMILGEDGKRLSKRHGAASVLYYREMGILPQALLNYLVRLGWSHGDKEIFSLSEMIELFDLTHLNKSSAAVNIEKLLWINQQYLKMANPTDLIDEVKWHADQLKLTLSQGPELKEVVALQVDRVKTLKELIEKSQYFYQEEIEYDEEAKAKFLNSEQLSTLKKIYDALDHMTVWDSIHIEKAIADVCQTLQLKLGQVAPSIRVAVTGNTVSPSIDKVLALIGRERVLRRLKKLTH